MPKCEKPYFTPKKTLFLIQSYPFIHPQLLVTTCWVAYVTHQACGHKIFKELVKSLQSHLQLLYRFMNSTYIKYNGYHGSFPGGKWTGCKIDNPAASSAEVKNGYSYTPIFLLCASTTVTGYALHTLYTKGA